MDFDQPPVVRVAVDQEREPLTPGEWPMTIPAVAQVVETGLDLVRHWRSYLDDPRRYLRHVLD